MAHVNMDMRYESIGSGGGKVRIKGLAIPYVHYAGSDSLLTTDEMTAYPDLQMVQAVAGCVSRLFYSVLVCVSLQMRTICFMPYALKNKWQSRVY